MDDERSQSTATRPEPLELDSLPHSVGDVFHHIFPIAARLAGRIDRLLPDSILAGPVDELRRARLTVAAGFVTGSAVLLTLVATTELASISIRVASYFLAAMFLLSPFLLKHAVPAHWIQNGLIGLMCMYSVALSAMTGGADTGGVFLAMVIPLTAIVLCGAAAGTVWSLITCIGLGIVGVVVGQGFEAPIQPNAGAIAHWNLWAGAVGILGTLGVALTYESLRESNVRDLDMAQRRADQAHLQQLEIESQFRGQLEKLVEERTQELIDSREQLRRADRLASVGTLAAGVAHQINNPVGGILLSAQLALTSGDEPDRERIYRHALESNAENAKRCGHIVRNLLRFARNDSTEKSPIDLNEITHESIGGLRELANRFDLILCEDPLPIHASGIEIEQVIVNLAHNAIESGHPPSSRVEIRTEQRGDVAILHVSDHGRGITDDDRARIFDPFFTTRIQQGGTGLGLSLAHGIIEDHGGRIDVHSRLGEGTRFSIFLPISDPLTSSH